jgi:hypothetical protein
VTPRLGAHELCREDQEDKCCGHSHDDAYEAVQTKPSVSPCGGGYEADKDCW